MVDQSEIVKVDTGDIWMSPNRSGAEAALLRVTLKATRILRGPRVDEKFSFLCTGDTMEASSFFLDGREVLVCGKYNTKVGTYYQSSRYGRYWNDAGTWKSELTPRGARAFNDAQLTEKINSVDMANVAAEATLAIDGTIVSHDFSPIVGPDSSTAELVTFVMRVNRVLKGSHADSTITIVAITRGLYMPAWRAHVPPPPSYQVGQRWLCLLKKNAIGWYPFAGTNGFLRMTDTGYCYDERVAFWHSVKQVERTIEEVARD